MKFSSGVFAFVLVATLSRIEANPIAETWAEFKMTHEKKYVNIQEDLRRLQIFSDKLNKIEQHNQLYAEGLVSYKLGVDRFSDWTQDEFESYLKRSKGKSPRLDRSKYQQFVPQIDDYALPSRVDWRDKGAVTIVKDQGQCGACWTFSTTGALESARILKTGQTTLLSEQELVDCITSMDGCNGGLGTVAFEYVQENGITSEKEYPYEASNGRCRRGNRPEVLRSKSYVRINSGSEDHLKNAVATEGPISVAVDATHWNGYAEGIFYDDRCGNKDDDLDHEVLLIGYGTDDGKDYWLIKNQWGTRWGERGFMKMARNYNNLCGIATDASYPVL